MLRLFILLLMTNHKVGRMVQFRLLWASARAYARWHGIYLTVSNHPMNAGGKDDKGDIWVSRWVDNKMDCTWVGEGINQQ